MKTKTLKNILSRFDQASVLVIGDLILDEFIWGKAERISPEAPVPVVWAQAQSYMPGGASNVANNIAALGGTVSLFGVIGSETYGKILLEKLKEKNIDCDGVLVDPGRPTTVKTRIIAGHQQMVRVDWEKIDHLTSEQIKIIIAVLEEKIKAADALIIEDYGKGLITPMLLKKIIALAKKHGKIITVDPKVEHFSYYKGVTAITPNEKEASAGSGVKILNEDDCSAAGAKLLKKLKCGGVLITQGEKGMTLFQDHHTFHIPTLAQEVFDVSGAGDTVISVFTLALACGVKMAEAAAIANLAAGIVVGKVGVAVVTREEILGAQGRLKGLLP